jgi:hypothetical protein
VIFHQPCNQQKNISNKKQQTWILRILLEVAYIFKARYCWVRRPLNRVLLQIYCTEVTPNSSQFK